MNNLAEQIIVDILTHEMDLDDQTVWIRNQNRKIPSTPGLFIVVGMVDEQLIASNRTMTPVEDPAPATLQEALTVITRANIMIDIMSRDTSAILRRWEVLASLASIYSVQKQEENNFKIFRLPRSFVDASEAEGGSNINRFSITIAAHVWYRKESNLAQDEIFAEFATRVDDEETIGEEDGLIEFTIDENTVILEE